MVKKLVVLGVAFMMCLGIFIGCQSEGVTFEDFGQLRAFVQEKAELNFLFPDSDLIKEIADEFFEEECNFVGTVNFSNSGGKIPHYYSLHYFKPNTSRFLSIQSRTKFENNSEYGASNVVDIEMISNQEYEVISKETFAEKNISITLLTCSKRLIAVFEYYECLYNVTICDFEAKRFFDEVFTPNESVIAECKDNMLSIVRSMIFDDKTE